jgi:NAD(P)-dependent dehydrogenase (short-subunit alcohol dehydrogenase family)/aminoglycoside phosphotransferase (APT) family kinase protein
MLDKFSLKGRVALVTGAGRGLGRGIALGLAEAGADVALVARTKEEIDEAAREIGWLGRRALAFRADVRARDEVEAAVTRVEAELGPIDILVNNAGGALPGSILEGDVELFDEVVDWNLKPVLLCSRAVARRMAARRRGVIINMSSLAATTGVPLLGAYAATKAAVVSLTRTMAQELAPHGIRVNAMAPGKVLTSHTSTAAIWPTPELQAAAARDIALGRLALPEDIAPLAVFLASDASGYITGETVAIDGGWGGLRVLDAAGVEVGVGASASASASMTVPAAVAPSASVAASTSVSAPASAEDDRRARLQRYLASRLPGADGIALTKLKSASAGFSNRTLFFDLSYDAADGHRRDELVLRLPPERAPVFPEYDLERQFRIMERLASSGVPVPAMRWLESDAAVLGAPFYIMDRVQGEAACEVPPYHSFGVCLKAKPEQRARMWWGCLDQIARVHALGVHELGLEFLGVPTDARAANRGVIDYYRRFLDWIGGEPQPILRAALDWLDVHVPSGGRVTLCWGDARLPNLLFRDFQVVAVLDWEMASIGDPESDLAWMLFLDWFHSEGSGIPRLDGFPSREETVRGYEERTGRRVEHLDFHEVLAALKFGVIMARIAGTMKAAGASLPAADYASNNPATQRLAALLDLPPPSQPREVTRMDRVTCRAQFVLTGPGGSEWYLEVEDGKAARKAGMTKDFNVKLTASAASWYAIQDGSLDRVQAFMQGLMKIEGDMSLLMQLEDTITRLTPPRPADLAKA